jgi:hypothetical protein
MQIDFHFYAVYGLARAAGFMPDHAYTIAYASQHTDDAKYDHALEFTNGGRFQQVLTAHRFFDPDAMSKETCYRIWVPFHFLPGNVGADFYERMLSRSGSTVVQRLVDDLVSSNSKPYLLHRLGILLHVYADTWSHQNFLGLEEDDFNDVRNLDVEGETETSLKSLFEKLKEEFLEYTAPKLGHAQAGTIPDEPYRQWKYENFRGRRFDISNVERALDAAQSCYRVLTRFLSQFPGFSYELPVPWHRITTKVSNQFQTQEDLENRIRAWKGAISGGELGFKPEGRDMNLNYDDREWFREAVKVDTPPGVGDQYERNSGFETSNWKYFHDAAAFHRFTVLHEVLPEYGIICG